jgi:hypothetical protein
MSFFCNKKSKIILVTKCCFFLLSILLIFENSIAQDGSIVRGDFPVPSTEKFESVEQLLMPQRSIRCLNADKEANVPNCVGKISPEIWDNMDALSLYNRDGSLWDFFSLNRSGSNHFSKKLGNDFLPFSISAGEEVVIFRLVGESENWYEIEINEKTQISKFIPKKDTLWSKVSWVYFLAYIKTLDFGEGNRPQLLDKPNGNPISEVSAERWTGLRFRLKIERDWAYVEGYKSSKSYKGWVKWRDARKMLFSAGLWKYKFN